MTDGPEKKPAETEVPADAVRRGELPGETDKKPKTIKRPPADKMLRPQPSGGYVTKG